MVKNADKLYYPIKESISSILPIVDEFVVALGDNDSDDQTLERIQSINSDKIKIIRTTWDAEEFPEGTVNAQQTDIAKQECKGDWLFYLQADEVIHEKYHPAIVNRCEQLLNDKRIEGLLFRYKHFWGDYNHYLLSHGWYPNEIRIIRNDNDIHSWCDAQSFRRIPDFDFKNYRQQSGTYKLNVATVDAEVFHYGWVRPPKLMQTKRKSFDKLYHDAKNMEAFYSGQKEVFNYGPMKRLKNFTDIHPEVMKDWIAKFDWSDLLDYTGNKLPDRDLYKHEKLKYRIVTWMEQNLMGGKELGGFKNYNLIEC